MRKQKLGFTMIEVSLFLAITGALLVAIIVSTNNSVVQQRYNDSVQNFAEFLRGIYAKVTNVQGVQGGDGGRSEQAIYGKLVTFGEEDNNKVFTYDVVGKAEGNIGGGNILETLKGLSADVVKCESALEASGNFSCDEAGMVEEYKLNWGANLKNIKGDDFKGALLVVRSPMSGTIYTYWRDGALEVQKQIQNQTGANITILSEDVLNSFKTGQVDFCVGDADGSVYGGKRTDVRLLENARNAASVEIMPLDGTENKCE